MRRAGCCDAVTALLTLDAAGDGCSAGVVRDGVLLAERRHAGGRGSSAILPYLADAVLREAGVKAGELSGVAVTVGPGSFTGVRAALALAHGVALGAGLPIWGVRVGAALRAVAGSARPIWVAVDSKRGRVFLDRGGSVAAVALDALPRPDGPVALAGDAAVAVASRLAAAGCDIELLPQRRPEPVGIATGERQQALPLYVDPPEARPGPVRRPAPA